jgi:exodeoxyribonuclease V alpha subunit
METELSGVVERVTFHNADSGFAVLRVQVVGRRAIVTVVGTVPSVNAGERVEATGQWIMDRQHGEQFKASTLRCCPPTTKEGIERYLSSGLVKGIGGHYAKKIVARFGERTLDVIDESPTYLAEIKGLGPKRIQRIRESWQEQKAVRGIMIFLQSNGIGTSRAWGSRRPTTWPAASGCRPIRPTAPVRPSDFSCNSSRLRGTSASPRRG